MASAPPSWVKSPVAIKSALASRPASASASRYPARRSMPGAMSAGPLIVAMVL